MQDMTQGSAEHSIAPSLFPTHTSAPLFLKIGGHSPWPSSKPEILNFITVSHVNDRQSHGLIPSRVRVSRKEESERT